MSEPAQQRPAFHTVTEAAAVLRVDPVTIYRAIREDAFPAVKIRGRYIVPTQALDKLASDATNFLTTVDVADYVVDRRASIPTAQ